MFLTRPKRTSSRIRSGSAELSNSVLDPRVEICIIVYSDAICSYNNIQAEADKSRRDLARNKEDIEERLETSRNSRKHFLQGSKQRSNSTGSQSSQNSISVEEGDGRWYPGKMIMKHFSSSGSASPRHDEKADDETEVAASAWRSVAQELLDFEVKNTLQREFKSV